MAYISTFVQRLVTGLVNVQECSVCHALVYNTANAMLEHVKVLHEPDAT